MGQAKRRGTYEERRRQAINRQIAAQNIDRRPEHLKQVEQRLRNRFATSIAAMAMISAGFIK